MHLLLSAWYKIIYVFMQLFNEISGVLRQLIHILTCCLESLTGTD